MHRLLLAPGLVAALVATPSPAQAAGPAALACCVKLPLITWVTAIGSRRGGAGTPQASAKRLEAPRRWGVGTWLGGLGLQGPHEGSAAGPLAFGGVGLQARYRVRRAWGLELSAGALHASTPGGVTGRDMFPVSGSLMAYLKPEGFLQIYGLAGLGLAPTRWYVMESDVTLGASTAGVAQAGGGITLAMDPLRLHADLRATAVRPSMHPSEGRPPIGSLPCATCGDEGPPSEAARVDPKAALVGSALTLGASFVF